MNAVTRSRTGGVCLDIAPGSRWQSVSSDNPPRPPHTRQPCSQLFTAAHDDHSATNRLGHEKLGCSSTTNQDGPSRTTPKTRRDRSPRASNGALSQARGSFPQSSLTRHDPRGEESGSTPLKTSGSRPPKPLPPVSKPRDALLRTYSLHPTISGQVRKSTLCYPIGPVMFKTLTHPSQ